MIHHWECKRCTHQWCSSCMGEMLTPEEDHERNSKQLWSHLCWDCFEQLETGEIAGLEMFELYFYLRQKADRYGGKSDGRYVRAPKYSGMTQPYVSDPNGFSKSNFVSSRTDEENQLSQIVSEVEDVYEAIILRQRTSKRIELDEFNKNKPGFIWLDELPRPEGFVGDPPGKQRPEFLFGIDPARGNLDIIAPTIVMNDGTGQACELNKDSSK